MNVLGISCFYHDSAVALVQDGKVAAAIEEERLNRKKHDRSFPKMAIHECMRLGGISAADIDRVAFYEKPLRKVERTLGTAKAVGGAGDEVLAHHVVNFFEEAMTLEDLIRQELGRDVPIDYMEHHLSHAASAFLPSPYEDAAVLTVDGVGEWATTAQWHGKGPNMELLREIQYPHSLGMLYSAMTAFLGFKVNNDKYKVMGLASYGDPKYVDKFKDVIEFYEDGSFKLNMDYFCFDRSRSEMFSDKMIDLFGPSRGKGEPVGEIHRDIAASLQDLTEEGMVRLAKSARELTGSKNLCMAGGVAYNCVANSQVLAQAGFDNVWVQPAAGDSGCALGAALYVYHQQTGERTPSDFYSSSLGPSFDNEQIEEALDEAGVDYIELDDDALFAKTAELISKSYIIGWHQGRLEFGPRALGNRSILGNATDPAMKDILNSRVKFREDFRPFAPATLKERSHDFFEMEPESPFMLFTPQVKKDSHEKLPSITHADGTARIQTVTPELNERFYRTIEEFGKITDVPVVINTSFNVNGEPIVCTPADAINCFLNTDIDFLVIGNYIATKTG